MLSLRYGQLRRRTFYPPSFCHNADQKLCHNGKSNIDEYPLLNKDFGSSDTYDIPVSLVRLNAESSTAAPSRSVSSDPPKIYSEGSAETIKNLSLGLAVVPSTFAPNDIIVTESSSDVKKRLESVPSSDPPTKYEVKTESERGRSTFRIGRRYFKKDTHSVELSHSDLHTRTTTKEVIVASDMLSILKKNSDSTKKADNSNVASHPSTNSSADRTKIVGRVMQCTNVWEDISVTSVTESSILAKTSYGNNADSSMDTENCVMASLPSKSSYADNIAESSTNVGMVTESSMIAERSFGINTYSSIEAENRTVASLPLTNSHAVTAKSTTSLGRVVHPTSVSKDILFTEATMIVETSLVPEPSTTTSAEVDIGSTPKGRRSNSIGRRRWLRRGVQDERLTSTKLDGSDSTGETVALPELDPELTTMTTTNNSVDGIPTKPTRMSNTSGPFDASLLHSKAHVLSSDLPLACSSTLSHLQQGISRSKSLSRLPSKVARERHFVGNIRSSSLDRIMSKMEQSEQNSLAEDVVNDVAATLQHMQSELERATNQGKRVSREHVIGALQNVMGKLNAAEYDSRNEMALDGCDTSFVIADSRASKISVVNPKSPWVEKTLQSDESVSDASSGTCGTSKTSLQGVSWWRNSPKERPSLVHYLSRDQDRLAWDSLFSDLIYPFQSIVPSPCDVTEVDDTTRKTKVLRSNKNNRSGYRWDEFNSVLIDLASQFDCLHSVVPQKVKKCRSIKQRKRPRTWSQKVRRILFKTKAKQGGKNFRPSGSANITQKQKSPKRDVLSVRIANVNSNGISNQQRAITPGNANIPIAKQIAACSSEAAKATSPEPAAENETPNDSSVSTPSNDVEIVYQQSQQGNISNDNLPWVVIVQKVTATTVSSNESVHEILTKPSTRNGNKTVPVDLESLRSKTLKWAETENIISGSDGLPLCSVAFERKRKGKPRKRAFRALKSFRKKIVNAAMSSVMQPKSMARSTSNMNGLSNRGFFGRSFRRNSMRLDNPIPITNMVALSTPPGPPISSSPDRESRLKYNCNEDIEDFFLNPCHSAGDKIVNFFADDLCTAVRPSSRRNNNAMPNQPIDKGINGDDVGSVSQSSETTSSSQSESAPRQHKKSKPRNIRAFLVLKSFRKRKGFADRQSHVL